MIFNTENAAQFNRIHRQFSPLTIQVNLAKDAPLSPQKTEAIKTTCDLGIVVEMHSYNDPNTGTSLSMPAFGFFTQPFQIRHERTWKVGSLFVAFHSVK